MSKILLSACAIALVVLGFAVSSAASPQAARSHAEPCQPLNTIEGPLGFETVTKVDFISCAKATRILKKHDGDVDREAAFTKGAHFRLGNFRCGVRKVFTESARARCSEGDPMFRIDYGA